MTHQTSTFVHQNQAHPGYLPSSNNYNTNMQNGIVSYSTSAEQWTESHSVQSPMQATGTGTNDVNIPSENLSYKNWKSKFSSKDSNGFHCLVCQGKSFTADSSLKRHFKQVHEQTCKTCKMQFSEECALSQHIKDHHEFRCNICSKVFSANSSLKRHHDQQHGGALPGQKMSGFPSTAEFSNGNIVS